jgi:phenylpyruvate tautomerase PptA (4-oxalocrotonate tautomerase family)
MKTNYRMDAPARTRFLQETAAELSDILRKPLPAVMVMLDEAEMYMNNSEDTVFFAEFRYILPEEFRDSKSEYLKVFADRMLELIRKHTNADPYRIYMQFTEMTRDGAWRYTGKDGDHSK